MHFINMQHKNPCLLNSSESRKALGLLPTINVEKKKLPNLPTSAESKHLMQFHNKFEYFCPKCSFLSFYYLILTPSRFYCWSWWLEIKLARQIWQQLNAFSLMKARPAVTHNYIWTLECGEVRTRCSSLPCAPTLFWIFSSFSRLCEVAVSLTSKIMPQRMILTASN